MQFRRIFGTKSDGKERAIGSTDDGRLKVDADISSGLDAAGLATQTTLDSVKTAVEAIAVATPDTSAGDLAAINSASASIDGTLGGMSADLGTVKTDLATVKADIALMKADLAAILAILES